MNRRTIVLAALCIALLVPGVAPRAFAQGVEVGTSLTSATFGTGDDDTKVFGVPSSGFGIVQPSVFASLFIGSRASVEPQLGLIWASRGGESIHFLNAAAQFNYFLFGKNTASPYVFVSGGVVDVSEADENPKTISGGGGYRWRIGDRLAFRLDGRYTHFTNEGGNSVSLAFSLGGLFGQP